MNYQYQPLLAQAYGQGGYATCKYRDTSSCGGITTTSSLFDTGLAVAVIITLASLIMLAALLARFWRRRPAEAEVEVEADASTDED